MKIAVLGGGGFRTPLVWLSIADIAEQITIDHVVLHDIDPARLTYTSAVIEGLRRERGGPGVDITADLNAAAEGADVVFCAIRVGGLEGRVVDETVPLREGILGQETVGPGGICFALRTVPVMLGIAEIVAKSAPSAWFLNFTNPAGLVTEALRPVLGHRVVGICDSPAALCRGVAATLARDHRELEFDYSGLNHLGWLTAARDGSTDLLPLLLSDERLDSLDEARLFGRSRVRELGMIPNEYLVYYEKPEEIVASFRRAGATRAEVLLANESRFYSMKQSDPGPALEAWRKTRDLRFGTYMAEAKEARIEDAPAVESNTSDDAELGYGAIAAGFVRGVFADTKETLILNVSNEGRLPWLDDDAIVEIPCEVTKSGPRALAVNALPPREVDLVSRVKDVERLTIRAATEGSRNLALEAIARHPVVGSRDAGERILARYLNAFPELAARLS